MNNKNLNKSKITFFDNFKDKRYTTWNALKMLLLIGICILFVFLTLSIYYDTHIGLEADIVSSIHRRWPKMMMAFFSGGAIAVAGVLLQKVTRNYLSDVSILGIGSLNIILMTFYLISVSGRIKDTSSIEMRVLPIIMFLSSVFGTGIIYTLSRLGKANTEKFIVVGIALNFLFEAISVVVVNPSNYELKNKSITLALGFIQNYTLGIIPNSKQIDIPTLVVCSTLIALTLVPIWFLRKKIDLYETSEDIARTTGINTEKLRIAVYSLVAILAGLEIVLVGYVALLGVIGGAVARKLFGNKTSLMMFGAFFIGAAVVLIALFISNNLNTQIPVGFLATTIIVPYFMYLIIKGK
nr:iron ABC transporter permease [Ureaplasma canigenitalium]